MAESELAELINKNATRLFSYPASKVKAEAIVQHLTHWSANLKPVLFSF
jgi:hypothetical protein